MNEDMESMPEESGAEITRRGKGTADDYTVFVGNKPFNRI